MRTTNAREEADAPRRVDQAQLPTRRERRDRRTTNTNGRAPGLPARSRHPAASVGQAIRAGDLLNAFGMRGIPDQHRHQDDGERDDGDAACLGVATLVREHASGRQVHRHHHDARQIRVDTEGQPGACERRPSRRRLTIELDHGPEPQQHERNRIVRTQSKPGANEMRGRERNQDGGQQRTGIAPERDPRYKEHEHDIQHTDQCGRQSDRRLGERQELQDRRRRVHDHRIPAGRKLRLGKKDGHEASAEVVTGRRNRLRLQCKLRLVVHHVDRRVAESRRVQGAAENSQHQNEEHRDAAVRHEAVGVRPTDSPAPNQPS